MQAENRYMQNSCLELILKNTTQRWFLNLEITERYIKTDFGKNFVQILVKYSCINILQKILYGSIHNLA